MLAEIYMLRLEAAARAAKEAATSSSRFVPRLVAGSEGFLTRQAILALPSSPTPSRHPKSFETAP